AKRLRQPYVSRTSTDGQENLRACPNSPPTTCGVCCTRPERILARGRDWSSCSLPGRGQSPWTFSYRTRVGVEKGEPASLHNSPKLSEHPARVISVVPTAPQRAFSSWLGRRQAQHNDRLWRRAVSQ